MENDLSHSRVRGRGSSCLGALKPCRKSRGERKSRGGTRPKSIKVAPNPWEGGGPTDQASKRLVRGLIRGSFASSRASSPTQSEGSALETAPRPTIPDSPPRPKPRAAEFRPFSTCLSSSTRATCAAERYHRSPRSRFLRWLSAPQELVPGPPGWIAFPEGPAECSPPPRSHFASFSPSW